MVKGLLPGTLTYVGIRIGAGVLGLASYSVFSRVVEPAAYGRYALVVAAAIGLSACFYTWLGITLIRYLPDQRTREDVHLSSALALFSIASAVLILGCVGLAAWAGSSSLPYLFSCLILTLLTGWFGLSLQLSNARLQVFAYGVKNLVRFAGLLGFGLAFVWAGGGGLALVLAHILALAVATCFGIKSDFAGVALAKVSQDTMRKLLHHGLPVAFALFMSWMVDQSDRYLLLWFQGEAEAGRYALAYDIAKQPVLLMISAAGLTALPHAARAYETDGPARARQILSLNLSGLLLVSLPVLALQAFFPHELARLLLGSEYENVAAAIMPIIAVAMMIHGLRGHYFDIALHLAKRTRGMIGMWVSMATANTVLNLLLIPRFGSVGAAYATLLAHFVAIIYFLALLPSLGMLAVRVADLVKLGIATIVFVGCLNVLNDSESSARFIGATAGATVLYGLVVTLLNPAGARALLTQIASLAKRNK